MHLNLTIHRHSHEDIQFPMSECMTYDTNHGKSPGYALVHPRYGYDFRGVTIDWSAFAANYQTRHNIINTITGITVAGNHIENKDKNFTNPSLDQLRKASYTGASIKRSRTAVVKVEKPIKVLNEDDWVLRLFIKTKTDDPSNARALLCSEVTKRPIKKPGRQRKESAVLPEEYMKGFRGIELL